MKDIKNVFKELERKTMIRIQEHEMESFVKEYGLFTNFVEDLNEIDTEGVEPLIYPYDIETSFLREDESIHIINREDALKNAKHVKDYQIQVPKVVK